MPPTMLRLRTVSPRTIPRYRTMRKPWKSEPVVTSSRFGAEPPAPTRSGPRDRGHAILPDGSPARHGPFATPAPR